MHFLQKVTIYQALTADTVLGWQREATPIWRTMLPRATEALNLELRRANRSSHQIGGNSSGQDPPSDNAAHRGSKEGNFQAEAEHIVGGLDCPTKLRFWAKLGTGWRGTQGGDGENASPCLDSGEGIFLSYQPCLICTLMVVGDLPDYGTFRKKDPSVQPIRKHMWVRRAPGKRVSGGGPAAPAPSLLPQQCLPPRPGACGSPVPWAEAGPHK